MKTITFFSEKGGVGKSSFSIMYASWLHKQGIKVAVADFNNRITFYRNAEISERQKLIKANPDAGIEPFRLEDTWPIINAYRSEIEPYRQEGIQLPHAAWFRDEIRKGRLQNYDIVLCDFPGSLSGKEFTDLLAMRLLNLIVIPTEKDRMTLNSTFSLANILQKNERNYCCFINKAQLNFRHFRDKYIILGQGLAKKGIPMLPDMVTYSERMMTIDKVDIIRSTFGYPDFDKEEYEKITDLGIGNLFIDVTRELAKTEDIKDTPKADLDFIKSLEKKANDKSFKGSSFPEYE